MIDFTAIPEAAFTKRCQKFFVFILENFIDFYTMALMN